MDITRLAAGRNAIAYARKSTADPKNPGKSTADQTDETLAACREHGLNVVATLTDEGIGASKSSKVKIREGFTQAMAMIADPNLDVGVIAVWELSRATRRLSVFGSFLDVCEDAGVLLLIGGTLYNPADENHRTQLGISALMDDAETRRSQRRTLRGTKSSAAAGRPHGPAVYGYRRIYDESSRALLRIVEVPEQADVVREITKRVLSDESSHSIARDLNDRRIPRPRGGDWHPTEIRSILTSPTYAGKRAWHGEVVADGIWPAIITDDDFARLGAIYARRSGSRGAWATVAKHLLTGVIVCDRDDSPMYFDLSKGSKSTTAAEKIGVYHCPRCSRTRNALHLETMVRDTVNAWLADPAFAAGMASSNDDAEAARARQELAECSAELEDAYTLGLSARGLATVEGRLLPRIAELEQALAERTVTGQEWARARAAGIRSLPQDVDACRALLRGLVHVRVLEAKRGRGFDVASVEINAA